MVRPEAEGRGNSVHMRKGAARCDPSAAAAADASRLPALLQRGNEHRELNLERCDTWMSAGYQPGTHAHVRCTVFVQIGSRASCRCSRAHN
eukprot:7120327-Prymnesium_polylepis.1